jgi:hypothetical protein
MNLQKAKILLDKINSLFKSMSADEKDISPIERDLMRSYLQMLYEAVLESPDAPAAQPPATAVPIAEVIKPGPKISLRHPETAPSAQAAASQAPAAQASNSSKPPAPLASELKQAEDKRTPASAPAPPQEPPQPASAGNYPVDEEYEDLFSISSARELSEKLSELPIADIKKAIGINERIFTINELFGGNHQLFEETVQALNRLSSFDEARQYLLFHVAVKHNWVARDRKNKARNFIKLVKRRYN